MSQTKKITAILLALLMTTQFSSCSAEVDSETESLSESLLSGEEVISEDGSLYCLVDFDAERTTNEMLQEDYAFEAYDEDLDVYTEIAMNRAAEMYSSLHDAFSEEADDFLGEMEKILSALEAAMRFA